MKKSIFILAAIIMCFTAGAQLRNGSVMLGGNLNYNQNKVNDAGIVNYSDPQTLKSSGGIGTIHCGLALTNRIMVGIFGNYQNSMSNNTGTSPLGSQYPYTSTSKSNQHQFGGGVFARYYQMIGNSRLAWFLQLSAGYGAGKQTTKSSYEDPYSTITNTTIDGKISNYNITFNPGFNYFVTSRFAVELSFGNISYNSQTIKNSKNGIAMNGKDTRSGYNVGLSLTTLSLGINFYLGGKKEELPADKK